MSNTGRHDLDFTKNISDTSQGIRHILLNIFRDKMVHIWPLHYALILCTYNTNT
jgi:hypothetical protein